MADKSKNTAPAAKDTAVKAAAPAAEVKKEAAPKAEAKPEVKKEAAPKAEKPAAKKEAAPKAEKKPAAKKEAAPKAEKPAAKKTTKKKGVSFDDVVSASKKKMSGANVSKIKYPIAANVELNGSVQGIFYVYVSESGNVSVEPYKYDDYDIYFRADADEFMNVIGGKKNVYDALADGSVKVDGNTKKAVLFINAAF